MLKIDKNLEEYILKHTDEEGKLLSELNRDSHSKILFPRMLSGHLQGKILEMISRMINPVNILEIGTYTGYSAICLAKGLKTNGTLDSIEINDELIDFALSYINQTEYSNLINIHHGNAIDIIPNLGKKYDLIFIDANKKEYLQYYEASLKVLKPEGYILADNVLWDGKALEEPAANDVDTLSIRKFNDFVHKDTRVQNVLLPIRDGLMILRKEE